MHALLKKLQYKGNEVILVIDAPKDFSPLFEEMAADAKVVRDPSRVDRADFILVFSGSAADIARQLPSVMKKFEDHKDALLWWAYPKKSSKKYTSDIHRDHGWGPLGEFGFEAVRQVAIDDDWSALRFRKAGHIKTMTRDKSRAMSREGKKKLNE